MDSHKRYRQRQAAIAWMFRNHPVEAIGLALLGMLRRAAILVAVAGAVLLLLGKL